MRSLTIPSAALSRRSRTTRCCPTARSRRSSHRAETSSGCACRSSIRRACSPRCSTAGRALPLRAGRRAGADRAPLPARVDGGGDDLEGAHGLAGGARRADRRPLAPHHRARAPPAPRAERLGGRPTALVRTARCAQGMVELQLDCEPRFDYGLQSPRAGSTTAREATTRPGRRPRGPPLDLTFATDMNVGFEGPRLTGRTTLREGETAFVTLGWSEHPCPKTFHEAFERSTRRRSTGASGRRTASSPTTRGARTWNAAR